MQKLTLLALTFAFLSQTQAGSPEAIECMIRKNEGNCLKHIPNPQCKAIISECMREHPYDVIAAVQCSNDGGCHREDLKPEKMTDVYEEMICVIKCMGKAFSSVDQVMEELKYIFTGHDDDLTGLGE